jgi:hypothetical protein
MNGSSRLTLSETQLIQAHCPIRFLIETIMGFDITWGEGLMNVNLEGKDDQTTGVCLMINTI